ncbi:MAG: hypothetical protein M1821_005142 [Bathelium mastoideum]|nr:MAG: hypothetical protein M1821_005142 [Bathelium mastoideum]
MSKSASWEEIAMRVQAYRDETIRQVSPTVPGVPFKLPLKVTAIPAEVLTSKENDITGLAPEVLLDKLVQGQLLSTQVVTAYLRRAGVAQQLVNCITELLPSRALARATELDAYFTKHGKPFGPLHGMPISVKEHIGMKGLTVNAGFISAADKIAPDDATVLKVLYNAGCVFYARTTEPQTLANAPDLWDRSRLNSSLALITSQMHLETSSNLYGETVNPYNTQLTSGGSSGGEGALLALRGSSIGIGSDIVGSIRSPAANCGLYGLRPTSGRVPFDGIAAPGMVGAENITPVVGPLSTSLEGLRIFMKTVVDAKPWEKEPSLIPLPWRNYSAYSTVSTGNKVVKIGVMWDDGVVRPQPPVTRAMRDLVNALKACEGIEIIEWKPWKHQYGLEIMSYLRFCDGGKSLVEGMEATKEPLRPLTKFILDENPHMSHYSIEDLWKWTTERESYRAGYANEWNKTATSDSPTLEGLMDCILCPTAPGPAPQLNQSRYWAYTSQWNLLDYPALVFPVSKVDAALDPIESEYQPMNEKDEEVFRACKYPITLKNLSKMRNPTFHPDNPHKFENAPISLQLVGRRYEDEKVNSFLASNGSVVDLQFQLLDTLAFIKASVKLPFCDY